MRAMRRLALLIPALLALAACSGTQLNGHAAQHGPDYVILGLPF